MSRFRPGPSKKGKLSPYQAAKSFLPTSASACRVAQANWAYRQFAFFINPRYAIPGLCSVRDIGKPSGTAVDSKISLGRMLVSYNLGACLDSGIPRIPVYNFISFSAQAVRLCYIMLVGRRDGNRVYQSTASIHLNGAFHSKLPSVALLRLVHLRTPCLIRIFGKSFTKLIPVNLRIAKLSQIASSVAGLERLNQICSRYICSIFSIPIGGRPRLPVE